MFDKVLEDTRVGRELSETNRTVGNFAGKFLVLMVNLLDHFCQNVIAFFGFSKVATINLRFLEENKSTKQSVDNGNAPENYRWPFQLPAQTPQYPVRCFPLGVGGSRFI